jgi:hypothetical protein
MLVVACGELLFFGIKYSRAKCPNFPQLKHGKLWLGAYCGSLTAAVVVVVAEIAMVGIESNCPNSTAVVVDAADPQAGYTPCSTLEEHC